MSKIVISYLVYYSSGNIDIMSTEGFFPFQNKGLLQHTVTIKCAHQEGLDFTHV